MITGLAGIAILVRTPRSRAVRLGPQLPDRVRLAVGRGDAVHRARRVRLGRDRGLRAGVGVREDRRLPRGLQIPAAAASGIAFPVCECGSVPVARRLAAKGLAPSAAVTFMLAAPIVNPVVVASTYVAYRGRDTVAIMVLGRLALGFIVAMAVGWVLGAVRGDQLLKQRDAEVEAHEVDAAEPRWRRFFGHLTGDIVFMARFLILGAAIAAAVQTFIPQSFLNGVANLPILSLIAMMALAFIMSLCSESDAFDSPAPVSTTSGRSRSSATAADVASRDGDSTRSTVDHAGYRARSARALAASTSRFFGGALVTRSSSRCSVMWAISARRSKTAWLACDGLVVPLTLRTNCSAAAVTSSRTRAARSC